MRPSANRWGIASILVGPGLTLVLFPICRYLFSTGAVQMFSETDRLIRITLLAGATASVTFAFVGIMRRRTAWIPWIALPLSVLDSLYAFLAAISW
jgi:hypothetical protein